MNEAPIVTPELLDGLNGPTSRWVGILSTSAGSIDRALTRQPMSDEGEPRKLYLEHDATSVKPLCARNERFSVIFDGTLYNRQSLKGELRRNSHDDDAQLILAAYEKWGEDLLPRLRGTFSLIIWESSTQVLRCLRDPVGTSPMFYAEGRGELFISPSIDALVKQPQISGAVNRAALADYMLDRFPRMEETFFESVKRVPPGHVLRATRDGLCRQRYWDPAPNGKVEWLSADELEGFDELLDQAVSRCLSLGPAGIFLSGGLDSVSVAAVAAHRAASNGTAKPLALSLVFPDSDVNEESVQRGVAHQLGLPQVLRHFYQATGESGLLAGAVRLNRHLSGPISNTWLPAYHALVRDGKERGCRTILTGSGGDEWLTVSPMLAADLWRKLDLVGVYRLWRTARRSFRRPDASLLRAMIWTFGLGPLIIPRVHGVMKRFAPSLIRMRRQLLVPLPKWLAPDPELRRELEWRWHERSLRDTPKLNSFYIEEAKTSLDHPLVSREIEELFNFGQMAGVRVLHPIWDPDLVDLLYRTPPFLLIREGRNKGLVRDSLARRFPQLGFEQQRKIEATRFYASLIYRDARRIWQELGGATTLSDLGIVSKGALTHGFERLVAQEKTEDAHTAWSILNLESWARAHNT